LACWTPAKPYFQVSYRPPDESRQNVVRTPRKYTEKILAVESDIALTLLIGRHETTCRWNRGDAGNKITSFLFKQQNSICVELAWESFYAEAHI